jgi:hypothetical protein
MQLPCSGNYCYSPLHISQVWGLCAQCGNAGQGCCNTQQGSTVACFGGTQCIDNHCEPCGGDGQRLCPNGQACAGGLVWALAPGKQQWGDAEDVAICAQACGGYGQLPCWEYYTSQSGCTQLDTVLPPGSTTCQWRTDCGHAKQECCDSGNAFQSPNGVDTGLCHDGSTCTAWIKSGHWMCVPPGSGGPPPGCDESCDECDPIDCSPCWMCSDETRRSRAASKAR